MVCVPPVDFFFFSGRFGECSVQVLIGDENDNSPSFVNLPNDTSVSEAADLNTNVFQIQVGPEHFASNSRVVFTINMVSLNISYMSSLVIEAINFKFVCSLTINITSQSMKNLIFHQVLR